MRPYENFHSPSASKSMGQDWITILPLPFLSSECTAKCIGNLTAGKEEKTMFNGYVLEPLVLLVEVSELYSILWKYLLLKRKPRKGGVRLTCL